MRQIQVILTVRDNEDPTPTCAITSVTSTEPVTGPNYGNFAPDWNFNGLFLELRAERYSKQGRTYTVTVLCSDDAGNTTTTRGTVRVPHDMGHDGDRDHDDLTAIFGGGESDSGGGHSSGRCCIRDDDDDLKVWSNDLEKKGGHTNRCPVPDRTPPVISNMPANITVWTMDTSATVSWPSPTAYDLVDGVRPVTCVPPSGASFPIGVTTVTCSASDLSGNTASRTFTVTVIRGDNNPPEVCMTLKGSLWPPNHKMRQIAVLLNVRDNTDPNPTCAITSVTSSEPVTGRNYGSFAPDWNFSGLSLELRAERYGSNGRTYAVTVLCSDASGNTTTTRGTVRVPHDMGDLQLVGGEDDFEKHGGSSSGRCCQRNIRDRREGDNDELQFFWTNELDEKKGPHDGDRCYDDDDDGATLFRTN